MMEYHLYIVVLCLAASVRARARHVISMEQDKINNRPIIGILTEPTHTRKHGDEFIEATYVKYLESAGARVVPIRGNQPEDYYKKMFNSINGVLIPGGGVSIVNGSYYESGKYMYEMALQANDCGDFFPIWATCLGMELLTVLRLNKNILRDSDAENITLPLDLVNGYKDSRLFGSMPSNIIKYLHSEPVTQNNHHFSLSVEDFEASSALSDFYHVLSTNVDRKGLKYVSTMEARNYPIYAVQWHPEKNIFMWNPQEAVDHSFHALQVTQYMANFFVNQARKNQHHFESVDEEAHSLIENAVRIYVPSGRFSMNYFFNYTSKSE